MQPLYRAVMLSLLLLPLTACGGAKLPPPGAPIEGKVLEAGTNKPIPGAIVVVRWQGSYSQIVETKTVCYHVETATTDAEGKYRTPAWQPEDRGPNFTPGPYLIDAYKAGYERDWPPGFDRSEEFRRNVYFLKPFKGTREERFAYLQRTEQMMRGCRSPDANEKALVPLYRAAYGEVSGLAQTNAELSVADGFLTEIDIIQLGYKEGMKRGIDRAQKSAGVKSFAQST